MRTVNSQVNQKLCTCAKRYSVVHVHYHSLPSSISLTCYELFRIGYSFVSFHHTSLHRRSQLTRVQGSSPCMNLPMQRRRVVLKTRRTNKVHDNSSSHFHKVGLTYQCGILCAHECVQTLHSARIRGLVYHTRTNIPVSSVTGNSLSGVSRHEAV